MDVPQPARHRVVRAQLLLQVKACASSWSCSRQRISSWDHRIEFMNHPPSGLAANLTVTCCFSGDVSLPHCPHHSVLSTDVLVVKRLPTSWRSFMMQMWQRGSNFVAG